MAAPLLVLLVLAACSAGLAAKLPAGIQRCHVNDADFDQCLRGAIEGALRSLKDGEKSLGLPPISPLLVEKMDLDLGSGPIPLVIHASNITMAGLDTNTIKEAHLDVEKHLLTVTAFTPRLRLDFQYTATGRILLVAVNGEGPAFFDFEGMTSHHKVQGVPFQKKGKTYWNITDYNVAVGVQNMKCHFDGLMKGNPQVSDQVNKFLNDDWKVFFDQIKVPAQAAFGAVFQQLASRLFGRVPIADIYLDL